MKMSLIYLRGLLVAILSFVLLGVGAPAPAVGADEDAKPIFYPAAPNPPRIQFLKTFSSALDVSSGKGGFRDFVFGGGEYETQLLQKPYGLAIKEGAIYVVDMRNNGYAVFDIANNNARIVKPAGSASLQKPINITLDSDGNRYITDTQRNQVVVFDANDRFVRALGSPGQFTPGDVAITRDRLYVSDLEHHQIVILDKTTGEELERFGRGGSGPGQFAHPNSLALGPDETLLVTDTSNFRVQEFDLEGNFIREMGSAGTTPGHFSRPKGLDADRDGYLYVVDAAFNNIQILSPEDGGALMAFGSLSDKPDSINLPSVVKIDYDNLAYFRQFAAEGFEIEYLILVTSQFGGNKVTVFGYGHMQD